MWAAAMRQFNSFCFVSYCPNSQQQLLESFLYCKIKYSDHSEKSIVNLYYSWKQWDRQCSMWVMAAGSLSSFSVRRAVKGYDWHEVLSLVPRHTSYPLLPGPFVLLNTHTHTDTICCGNSQAACRSSTQPPLLLCFLLFIPLSLSRCLLFGGKKPGYSELLFVAPPQSH